MSDGFPRMVTVTFQHPTPFFDDSYAVNSANNGPYGDALLTELIPYLEQHFRISREPYARVLTGGSTGGWESLALQVHHPDFFGGTWTLYPDRVRSRLRLRAARAPDDAHRGRTDHTDGAREESPGGRAGQPRPFRGTV